MNVNKQMIVGMMDTGKTSFIAALFHTLESGEVAESLKLAELGENRAYLVQLQQEWLGGEVVERTYLGKEKFVQLILQNEDSGEKTELTIPDVSGETFRDQWEKRLSTKVFDDFARGAENMLLFVHPDTVRTPVRIGVNKEVASVLPVPPSTPDPDEVVAMKGTEPALTIPTDLVAGEEFVGTEWHPRFAPTQVKITEIIQLLSREPHIYPLRRVAMIVSAWDLLRDDYEEPLRWVQAELPLVHQLLVANSDRIEFEIFGVSALGGPLDSEKESLLRQQPQSSRIEVSCPRLGEFNRHDISMPIKWLMKDLKR